jgi:hypothetical protein
MTSRFWPLDGARARAAKRKGQADVKQPGPNDRAYRGAISPRGRGLEDNAYKSSSVPILAIPISRRMASDLIGRSGCWRYHRHMPHFPWG